jgi:hypothetical protein
LREAFNGMGIWRTTCAAFEIGNTASAQTGTLSQLLLGKASLDAVPTQERPEPRALP